MDRLAPALHDRMTQVALYQAQELNTVFKAFSGKPKPFQTVDLLSHQNDLTQAKQILAEANKAFAHLKW